MRRFVLLPLATAVFLFMAADATAAAVTVPDDIPTLEAAMDSSTSPYGSIDTVFVRPGVIVDTLTAYNISGLTVIGLGDSTNRPEVKGMTINARSVLFINMRFSRAVRTVAKATMTFRECRIDGELTSGIDGDPRELTLIDCYVTGRILAHVDISVVVHSCRFDGGSVTLSGDGYLQVTNNTFTGAGDTAIHAYGDVSVICRDNRIENYAVGVSVASNTGPPVEVSGNTIDHCGIGIHGSGYSVAIHDNVVTHSSTYGIRCSSPSSSRVERNVVGWSGGSGIVVGMAYTDDGYLTVRNNTSFGNVGDGIRVEMSVSDIEGPVSVTHNLGYANHGFGMRSAGTNDPTLVSCNDWFANDSGAVAGIDPSPTDLAVDPRLCDPESGDVHLRADSPLLDAPGCGPIGALGLGCQSTPTLVTLFFAERDAEGVRVRWQIADPTRLNEVWVERADAASGPWSRVSTEQSTDGGLIVGLDRSALAERAYWYRLVAHEGAEVIVIGEPVSVPGTVTQRFALTRVTPNPGFGPLRLSFTLAREAAVEMDLLDVQGRLVAALVRGPLKAGTHTVEWMGPSTPGIFFVDYRYPGGHQVERVVRLR